jgi:hypothetical protein
VALSVQVTLDLAEQCEGNDVFVVADVYGKLLRGKRKFETSQLNTKESSLK